jgi:OOP family OmpA-OmpF porin
MKKGQLFISGILFLIITLLTGSVFAENLKGAVTLSPHIGGYIFDNDQNINSNPLYGIGLGYNFSEHLGIEGVFDYVDTDMKSTSREDVDTSIYRLDGLYHFTPDSDLVPYLGAGVGYIDIDTDGGASHSSGLLDFGGGIKLFITEKLAARGDIRYIIDFDEGYNNFAYSVGLTYMFGGKAKELPPKDSDGDGVYDDMDKCPDTPAGVTVDSQGCPLDSDGDGVYDYLDKCPGTPAGVTVDSNGCPLDSDGDGVYDYLDKCPRTPAGVTVDSNGCPLDSDGDGVYDYLDKCPGTPAGAPVDGDGCPLDSDGDGVYDYLDKCPDTPKGITVDNVGCPVPIKEKVSIELRVEFAFDRAEVKSIYHEHIQKVANFLEAYPDTIAEIDGHTDSIGTEEYNLKLSQRRAENVVVKMVEHGIALSRLRAVGYGESMPIADNNTKEGRQRNRRVVALIVTIVTK